MPSTISAGTTSNTALNVSADTSGVLAFQTNGTTTAMTITTAQNVGIGTTTPSGKLHTVQSGAQDSTVQFEAGTAGYASNLNLIANTAPGGAFNNITSFSGGSAEWRIGGSGNNNTIVFSTGSGYTERMRINSAGYVTTPFQPAFFAISSGVITPGSGLTKVSFPSVTPNISSSFSTSTSRFTAPVAGTYFFTGLVTYDSTGSASYVGCLFYRNGSNIYSTYNGKASGQYGQVKNSLVITLSAGDYMELYTDTNSGSVAYEGGRTYFMGYLLG